MAALIETVLPLRQQSRRLHGRLATNVGLLAITLGLGILLNFVLAIGAAQVQASGLGLLQIVAAAMVASLIVTLLALDGAPDEHREPFEPARHAEHVGEVRDRAHLFDFQASPRSQLLQELALVGREFWIGLQGSQFTDRPIRRLHMANYFRRTWPALACTIVVGQTAAALPSHPIEETFAPTAAETQGGTVSTVAGTAVAIRAGTALVGMPGIDTVGIFSRSSAGWSRTGSILPPETAPRFGRALALCNDTVVVGAEDAAYVFRLRQREWRFTAKLTSPALDPSLGFPTVLDCRNDVVAAGDDRLSAPGAVYIYELNRAGRLVSTQQLQLQGELDDGFGRDVALSARLLVVGAPESEGGSAYVYRRSARGWQPLQRLHAVDSENERFGTAVAINHGLIIVGAPGEDPVNTDLEEPPVAAGAAFTFTRSPGGAFVEIDRIRPSSADLANFIEFGDQIEVSAHRLAIHAIELIGGPGDFATGYVATYTLAGAQAVPLAITPFHPQLNSSLDLWRNELLIGQPFEERCGFDVCIGQANSYDLTKLQ